MPKPVIDSAGYASLIATLRREMAQGIIEVRRAVERQKVTTYWTIGEHIHAYVARHVESGGITRFYNRLSKDLNINSRTLQHCEQFYRYFPQLKPQGDLSWSHYRYLLRVDSARDRRKWVKRIRDENLTTNDVRFALSAMTAPDSKGAAGSRLKKPARGVLYTYRLVPAGRPAGEDYPWYVDCGFKNLLQSPPSKARLQNKYKYTSVKTAGGYSLRVTDVKPEKLYTYKAKLLRVIDGDTLHVIVDQGFGLRVRERLRLKGIDAPELHTLAGQKAKYWLENRLKGLPYIIIKTYRTDKYDRYIADVFTSRPLTGPQKTADTGIYLNQEIIDAGHAVVESY